MEKMYYGPLWPLPQADAETSIISGLNVQEGTSEYEEFVCKDLIISTPSTNTADVYLVLAATDGTFKRTNDGTIVLIIPPGGSRNIPQAQYAQNRYRMADFGVDYDEDYDSYACCAIMQ